MIKSNLGLMELDMKNKITVSAPGKLMLLGEHAVVYGRPCIVTAVDQRMKVSVEILKKPKFHLNAPDVKILNYKKPMSEIGKGDIPKGAKFVEIAVRNFLSHAEFISTSSEETLKQVQGDKLGLRITTKSEFSSKFGFGSSSAVTVCVIKALSELFDKKLLKKQIFDLAYKTVLDVQRKGSGFDVAVAVYGGTLYFVGGGKLIKQLEINNLPLIVGYSGIKEDTSTLINKLKQKFSKKQLDKIFDNIEQLVKKGKQKLITNDFKAFGQLMNENQNYLSQLGVSITKLDKMISAAISSGAYGAKLSGAGGGDCMIAIAPNSKIELIKKAIKNVGGQIIEIQTNAEGVKNEK